MTKFYVTQVTATEGKRSVEEIPTTVSPNFPRRETAQKEALKLSGMSAEDADWWSNYDDEGDILRDELHRPNGTWTGYTVQRFDK